MSGARRGLDLLIERARVWTDGSVLLGADAVAVQDGRIVAVGLRRDLEPLADAATLRVDAAGATLTPGLTDAHLHLVEWARARTEIDLVGCASRAEALARVARFAAHGGAGMLVGRGFDANGWSDAPDRAALDAVTGGRPALLHSKDFHTVWANGPALHAAGVTRDSNDPPGGVIVRDGAGEPTGWLLEHATRLVTRLIVRSAEADADAVRAAIRTLHAAGVTAVHDFEGPEAARLLRAVTSEPDVSLRVLAHLAHAGLDGALAAGIESGVGDDRWRIGAVKLFADGTLGSRTAALLEPYDGTADSGMDLIPEAELQAIVARAVQGGISVAIHAIGDRAVRSSLDAFERSRERLAALALPPRIEHVQLAAAEDVPRFARLGVAASMQPSHCISDIDLARRHWSRRLNRSYAWRSLADSRALLAFGSDAPVEPPSVAEGLRAAVTRCKPGAREAFVPEQALTLDETLRAYTEGAARLAGAWPRTGTIRPGAWADLVVWDRDLHATDPYELDEARPVATYVEGTDVWSAAAADETAPPMAVAGGAGR